MIVVFIGEGEIAAAQLGQTQLPDHLLDAVGDGFAVGPGEGDLLQWDLRAALSAS